MGLDLVAFPTIVFYGPEYSVYTLRQASRRSWRIGQDRPVKVYYLYYAGTMQSRALHLMALKTKVAFQVEGELLDEGLVAVAGDEIFRALAKMLVEGAEEVEDLQALFRQVAREEARAGAFIRAPERKPEAASRTKPDAAKPERGKPARGRWVQLSLLDLMQAVAA